MKNVMKFLVAVVVMAVLSVSVNAQTAKQAPKKSAVVEVVKYTATIHCNSCKEKIEKNIPFEKGFKDLKIDMDKKIVTITFDPAKTNKAAFTKALEKLGVEPKLIETTPAKVDVLKPAEHKCTGDCANCTGHDKK